MARLNRATLIGRLASDPEIRRAGDKSVVSIRLATDESYKAADGNWVDKVEWHNLVFWERQADSLAARCRKGTEIYVEGKLQTRQFEDKDGNIKYVTEIKVQTWGASNLPKETQDEPAARPPQRQGPPQQEARRPQPQRAPEPDYEDGLPF